jgi:aspartyl-tRNA(Asn)/glutamyl-tRNA(Gln) amidotransferase subunit C
VKITPEEVRRTAALARLALSDDEVARFTRELDAIVGYMEKLSTVDVEGVPPMTHAVATAAPLRTDEVGRELGPDEALADAPARDGGFFQVPRIIAHDKET